MYKYYSIAIKKDHSPSMCNMGYYHQTVTGNNEEMINYYTIASEKENAIAMKNLVIISKI